MQMTKVGQAGKLDLVFGNTGMRAGISAAEVADIARLQIGNAWEYAGCTSLVYAITNLAGAAFYGHNKDPDSREPWETPSVYTDPVTKTGSTYFVPQSGNSSHADWTSQGNTYDRDDVWKTQDQIVGDGVATNGGSADVSWSTIADFLREGDSVRFTTYTDSSLGGFSNVPHSFIVSRLDEDGNVWVVDNGGGASGDFARTVTERPLLDGTPNANGMNSIESRYAVDGVQEWIHVSRINDALVADHGGDPNSLQGNSQGNWTQLEAQYAAIQSTVDNTTVNDGDLTAAERALVTALAHSWQQEGLNIEQCTVDFTTSSTGMTMIVGGYTPRRLY